MNVQGNKGEIVIYQTEDGKTSLEVSLVEDTVWLNLNHMVVLFDRDKSVISRHIKNIFREGEFDKKSVVAKYATTASDGKTYQVEYFNLDVIISVGYRIKSQRGTQFRIWANKILKDYLVKGYTLISVYEGVIFHDEIKKMCCFFFDTRTEVFAVKSLVNRI